MKKLTRKLFLSCAALCACAATLVSTTFAWYTSNTEVSASNVTGASATTGDASIFISGNGTAWYQKVDVNAATNEQKIIVNSTELSPQSFDSEQLVDAKGQDMATGTYVTFDLYFKTAAKATEGSATIPLYFKSIEIDNTTDANNSAEGLQLPAATNLLDGTSYVQDIRPSLALKMEGGASSTGFYSLNAGAIVSHTARTFTNSEGNTLPSSGNAHTYCNAVAKAVDPSAADMVTFTTSEAKTLEANTVIAQLPEVGTSVKVTFKIFLDGANTLCFDACKGQSFKINMSFTTSLAS